MGKGREVETTLERCKNWGQRTCFQMMEVREGGESEVEGALLSVALGHWNVF